MSRLGQCALDGPAMIEPSAQSCVMNASFVGPIFQNHASPLKFKPSISACISRLLIRGLPTAIPRLVISVVVFATDRMSQGRTAAHVFQKRRETIAPFLAHLDATAAIVLVSCRIRSMASVFGVLPSGVFSRFVIAMLRHLFLGGLITKAAAALRFRERKAAAFYFSEYPAGATTYPINMSASVLGGFREHRPSTKGPSGQVAHRFRHGRNLSIIEDVG